MTKQIFLEELRRYLSGMDYHEVNEHLRYYTEYIDSQIRQGKSEFQVMDELGDPRLIAKTLAGMEGTEFSGQYREEYIEDEVRREQSEHYFRFNGKTLRVPGWLFTVILCLVSFVLLTVLFTLISWLLPYFLLIMAGVTLYRFIRNIF